MGMIINDIVYGKQDIDDTIILKIIETPEMQRLKGVGQYGTYNLVNEFAAKTTRFDHSLGVYFLLRKLNAPFEEQVAGLIHDINHTAFSHVIDFLNGCEEMQDSGDKNQNEILEHSSIKKILVENGLDINKIEDKKSMHLLDNDIPEICADRLDYLLRDSLTFKRIGRSDSELVINSIIVSEGKIVLRTKEAAELLARLFIDMSSQIYATPWQAGSYKILADAIRISLEKAIIAKDDLMKTDSYVLTKMKNSGDKDVLKKISLIAPGTLINISEKSKTSFFVKTKFRYIYPLYYKNEKLVRVFDENKELYEYMKKIKKIIGSGYNIEIVEN